MTLTLTSTLTDIPVELIETVLVLSAASGNPSSIAALSQTNRFFYNLVYRCPDQHLWREIFLTTFDDPRPALNNLSIISGAHSGFHPHNFDWTQQYINRFTAATSIRHPPPVFKGIIPPKARAARPSVISHHFSPQDVFNNPSLLSVVTNLLSVITTSSPFPSRPSMSLAILTNHDSSQESNSHFTPVLNSINAAWLQDLLKIGFPPELTRTLLATISIDIEGRPPYHPALTSTLYCLKSDICHLFHKLVCCTGFIPISIRPDPFEDEHSPQPELPPIDLPTLETSPGAQSASVSAALDSAPASNEDEEGTRSLPPMPIPRTQSSFYSIKEQFDDARILARRRVYDMGYLRSTRMWGPFQPVRRDSNTSIHSHGGDDDDDEVDEDDDEDTLQLPYGTNRTSQVNPPIAPYELIPDYVWLASARIVVEANLQDIFRRSDNPHAFSMGDILSVMHDMHTTRIGGSPGYWDGWANRSSNKRNDGEVEGWDWAGISGNWKRCICWLDYQELLIHNLTPERFPENATQEECRLIPMTIWISGYSKSPVRPGSTTRPLPTIHVEGQSIGSDRSLHDVRKVSGTVSVIGDGAIRWSLVSSAPGSSEMEWSSEAVQIGGPGAAAGLLGMWTGALHERSDPLGPFWAWKVQ